ncbi:hypothetical protein O7602_26650 [Micromonospora sp. WMMD1128]|uniref:hypothetical protein n=1 Tax=Micromonospora sp. WMMD1128 TaxID=3015150 RepID=UPI00248D37A8|nr:hypothetical protein [Micromonospora sp. WMMD1128]WBB73224.1 hypothetical protein O7602_26650 [Micromonospora sp. WMMD1128]
MTLVGWCPGGRTVAEMLKTYEGTGAGRIFVQPRKALPPWDGPVLAPLVDAGVVVHLSYKTNLIGEVLAWVGRKPAGLRLKLTKNHEPEQQKDGDPTVEEFHAGQAELVSAFDGHPTRDEIWLGPTFTRYWWQANPGDTRWMPRQPVDFVGWDVYNNGATYRTPDDLLSIPRAVAEKLGVPYLVAELGAQRLPTDTDGTGQAAWMRAMVDAARADGALTVCWYHKEGWDLLAAGAETGRRTWQTITLEEAPVATTAPENLLAARRLLLDHLGEHGLSGAAVGIVGDPAHRGGYHCGSDRVVSNDYSVVESSRDRTGLARWACALDVGGFEVVVGGRRYDLPHLSAWLVSECAKDAPDTRDIREVIYSLDGSTVVRWDRLGRRRTGDSSHRWHTHISFHRDAIKAGRDQTGVFRRYLTTIGVIATEEDDMTRDDVKAAVREALQERMTLPGAIGTRMGQLGSSYGPDIAPWTLWARVFEKVITGSGVDVDEQAIVAGVLAGLPPERIAAAIPPEVARQVVDELTARLRE